MKKLPNGKWQVRWRDSSRQQRARNFKTQELARAFLRKLDRGEVDDEEKPGANRAFREVVDAWKKEHYPTIAVSSKVSYDRRIRLHFGPLLELPVSEITSSVIDDWIAGMIASPTKSTARQGYRRELRLLRAVLTSWAETQADDGKAVVLPIRKRHWKAVKAQVKKAPKPKDLSEFEFRRFLVELARGKDGEQMVALATIQFHHALRVSEVAGLHWQDVRLDAADPSRSTIEFRWHVAYLRDAEQEDRLEPGIKNSDGKAHPMFPPVYRALAALPRLPYGLVFRQPDRCHLPPEKQFWDYRAVVRRYERAFTRAGLPYTATHVMRHGGTRSALDKVDGDRDVARHLLGNSATIETYAARSSHVLNRFVADRWAQAED